MWQKHLKHLPRHLGAYTKRSASDYTYWQRSKIPTMHFQPSLPRLPIPKLEDSCERYLASQRPILSNDAYSKTEKYVHKFRDSIGKELQSTLVSNDKKNKHTSYISELWFDMYLRDRKPLPLNYNPVLVFNNDDRPLYNNQLVKTSNLIISSLRFFKSLQANILEPDVFHMNPRKSDTPAFRRVCAMVPKEISWYAAYLYKAYPLDMKQYQHLFHTSRIPKLDKDCLSTDPNSKHIVLQFKGNFYTFDVLDQNGDILQPSEIHARVKRVLESTKAASEFPIGVLTTLDRDSWAAARTKLESNGNAGTLHTIDTALFHVCLDETVLEDDKYALVRNFLHGDGANRWFDKSFTLQVSKDGFGGVNFEHAWGDGVAVLRYFQDIYKDTRENPRIHPGDVAQALDSLSVKEIDFNLDDSLRSTITQAAKKYQETIGQLQINYILSEGLGKTLCKAAKVSPDAIMQLSFQSAYYKQHGLCVPTYESCSTAAFRHGRTETIRPCTEATATYCQQMHSAKLTLAQQYDLIRQCSEKHMQLTKEAAMGQGFDRHLFALRKLAEEQDCLKQIELYSDDAYVNINRNILSTSTLSSPAILAGGFGPVVENGYGVGYVIRDESIGTLATSYPSCDSKHFIECLDQSVKEIVRALLSSNINK